MLNKLFRSPQEVKFRDLLPVFLFFFALILIGLREVWLPDGDKVFRGDQEQFYAFFHHFSLSLRTLQIPLWDPYTDLGGPIFPALSLWRLYDPLKVLLMGILNFLPGTIFEHFHVYILVNTFICFIGIAYLQWVIFKKYFQILTKTKILYYLFFQFLTLSFLYREFLMDTYITTVQYLPLAIAFLIRWLGGERTKLLWLSVFFLGLYIGSASYTFVVGLAIFLILILGSPKLFIKRWQEDHISLKSATGALLLLISLALPTFATYAESQHLVPLSRIRQNRSLFEQTNVKLFALPYDQAMDEGLKTSALQIGKSFFYDMPSSLHILEWDEKWIDFPIIFAIASFLFLSILFGLKESKKRFWPIILALNIFLLFLIQQNLTPLHYFFTLVFPPLKMVRNTNFYTIHLWIILTTIALAAFPRWETLTIGIEIKKLRIFMGAFGLVALFLAFSNLSPESYAPFLGNRATFAPDFFDHNPASFQYPTERSLFLPRPPWYLLESLLQQKVVAISTLPLPPLAYQGGNYPLFNEWRKYRAPHGVNPAFGLRTIFWSPYYLKNFLKYEMDVPALSEAFEINRPFAETFDRQKCNISDGQVLTCNPSGAANLSTKVLDFSPNNYKFSVSASEDSVLVVRDNYHRSWRAFIDGSPAPISLYKSEFKAVLVPPGLHEVLFRFQPIFFLWSLAISYLVTGLASIIFLRARRN